MLHIKNETSSQRYSAHHAEVAETLMNVMTMKMKVTEQAFVNLGQCC